MTLTESSQIFKIYTEMAYGIASNPADQNTVTLEQLVEIIKGLEAAQKGTNFFGISQVTKKTTKKAPEYPFVLSGLKNGKTYFATVAQVNGQIGFDYGNAVNKQRDKEGKEADFVAKASIYNPVEGSTAFEELDGQLYLRYKPISTAKAFSPKYLKASNPQATQFEMVDKAEVNQYITPNNTAMYQGVETAVEIRKISVSSIAAIKIGGREYMIADLDPMRKAIYAAAGAPRPIDNQQ